MDFSSMERKLVSLVWTKIAVFQRLNFQMITLKVGGGFCLHESDTGMDQGTAHSPPTTADRETGDLLEDVEHDTELLDEVRDGREGQGLPILS
ncbi:hypothetical protein OIU76_028481 [Salix suchowensis]|nr:hypothetical protein OIU76_028481 [Salix suchowensis]